ncbi:MAG: dihydroorotate oxidase [Patescibacteria group bacterium]|nr:dihydroorotate oxidase [Patescibacteria group bacterium]
MNSGFYDIYRSYEDNYRLGPINLKKINKPGKITAKNPHKFLNFEINTPFGIPSGPLLNNKFMESAFDFGFDISTYKTVRSCSFPSHPYPNIVFVKSPKELHPEKNKKLIGTDKYKGKISDISITNSFGVPSKEPEVWQEDVKESLKYAKKGQLLILSFMGTIKKGQTQEQFIDDFSTTAKLANETGAKVLEVNLSCPNLGNEGLVCYDLATTEKICRSVRKSINNTPLILKIGYCKNEKDLEKLTKIINEYASGVAAINTLQTEIVDKNGKQILPGNRRLKSGVCGKAIKWAGLEMVRKINNIRSQNSYRFSIIGVGGVMSLKDYLDYRKAGADVVQSATGAMWNPYLAYEIKKSLK